MRSYRKFLSYTGDMVLQMMRDAEENGWHHMDVESDEFQVYASLGDVLEEIVERAKHYVNEKGLTPEARLAARRLDAAGDDLDRLLVERQYRRQLTVSGEPDEYADDGGQGRVDSGEDVAGLNVP